MKDFDEPCQKGERMELDGWVTDFSNLPTDGFRADLEVLAVQTERGMIAGGARNFKLVLVRKANEFGLLVIDQNTSKYHIIKVTTPLSAATQQHLRLIREATRLKKAWLMAVAILGKDFLEIPDMGEYAGTDYSLRDDKWLVREIGNLRDDFDSLAKLLLTHWNPENLYNTSSWLAGQFDKCVKAAPNVYCIGRVHEVEEKIGRLGIRQLTDCPPYAQIVVQGVFGAGFRHPEYHLARDLALLYNLFLDSCDLMDEAQRLGKIHHSQNSQSLGRSVIQTCFSLLEAFITGLASAFVYENPNAPQRTLDLLKGIGPDGRYLKPSLKLHEKFARFPALITGRPNLDISQPPFRDLFGSYKKQRNAFAHPSMPFHAEDGYGVQNEARFHDITLDGVRETVILTCDAIGVVWKMIYGKPQPSWLPLLQSNGRFPGVDAKLAAVEALSQGGKASAGPPS